MPILLLNFPFFFEDDLNKNTIIDILDEEKKRLKLNK